MGLQDIGLGLQAPSKSIRLLSLETALHEPPSPALIATVEAYLQTEHDEECRHFAEVSLQHLRARGSPAAVPQQRSATSWGAIYGGLPREQRLAWITQISTAEAGELSVEAFSLIRTEVDPVLTAALLRTFGPSLPVHLLSGLLPFLQDSRFSVRVCTLELLVRLAPNLLLQNLPGLLTSNDLWVRALAIRGLFSTDPFEAVAHLEGMLLGPDPAARDLAIRNCFQVPFDLVKTSILKALATEQNGDRLKTLGLLCVTNPDPAIPHHLWILAEEASPPRADFLKDIVRKSMQAMEQAGILSTEKAVSYRETLHAWIRRRSRGMFWRKVLARWQESVEKPDPVLESAVVSALRRPETGEAFLQEDAAMFPPPFRAWVQGLLKETPMPAAPGPSALTVPDGNTRPVPPVPDVSALPVAPVPNVSTHSVAPDPASLSTSASATGSESSFNERIRTLARWPDDSAAEFSRHAALILGEDTESGDLKATALRTAVRLNVTGFERWALEAMQVSEPNLSGAGLEYLAEFAPDSVFPYLGRFLKSQDKRLKILAVRILQKFDAEQAVSRLRLLLRGTDEGMQRLALACLFHVDFLLIRDALLEFLETIPSAELFAAGIYLFRSNPDIGNPARLLFLERRLGGGLAETVRQARLECQRFLVEAEIWSKNDLAALEAAVAVEADALSERRNTPKPSYAYRPRIPEPTIRDQCKAFVEAAAQSRSGWILAGLFLLVVGLGWLLAVTGTDPADPPRGSLILSQERKIEGTVVGMENGWTVLETDRKARFLFRPKDDGFWPPKPGTQMALTVVPFRTSDQGYTFCRIKKMKTIH